MSGNNNVQSQPLNPIDVVPDKIPFDIPYGPRYRWNVLRQ
jgi:hypothetical protein